MKKKKNKSGLGLLIIWLSCFIVPFIYKLFGYKGIGVTSFAINERLRLVDFPGAILFLFLFICAGIIVVIKEIERKNAKK